MPASSSATFWPDGWPLYTYNGDVQPGQATGQAIDLNGGEWYVLRPSGAPLDNLP